jgi:thiol-disulfide isomerase/thioredoxin
MKGGRMSSFNLKISIASLFFASQGLAQELPHSVIYFKNDIDYWNDGKTFNDGQIKHATEHTPRTEHTHTEEPSQKNTIRGLDNQPFSWNNYIGDESQEKITFWDDGGDYVPPRPFRELAAKPTQENAKNFLIWLNKKNTAIENVNKVLYENNPNKFPIIDSITSIKDVSIQKESENKIDKINWENVNIVYFYSSTCPHCRKEKEVIDELIHLGAKITPVQIDFSEQAPIYENSIPFNKKLASDFQVKSVPKIFFKYNNSVIVFDGETSMESIIKSINI